MGKENVGTAAKERDGKGTDRHLCLRVFEKLRLSFTSRLLVNKNYASVGSNHFFQFFNNEFDVFHHFSPLFSEPLTCGFEGSAGNRANVMPDSNFFIRKLQ